VGGGIIYLYQMSVVKLLLLSRRRCRRYVHKHPLTHSLLSSSLPVIRERSFSAHQSDAAGVGDVPAAYDAGGNPRRLWV
jgi:hypothetical protein